MKKIFLTAIAFCFAAGIVHAGGTAAPKAPAQFKKYSMDHGYFSCLVPTAWTQQREKNKDEEYRIFEIQLLAPRSDKAPTSISVSYYAGENEDFDGYEDFIDRNSSNALGEVKSERETYEPVKKVKLNGRKGFELASEVMEYLHPETKSDESVQLKEKMYVLPAKEGFYVLKFNAPKELFAENLPVFVKLVKSFKGKY